MNLKPDGAFAFCAVAVALFADAIAFFADTSVAGNAFCAVAFAPFADAVAPFAAFVGDRLSRCARRCNIRLAIAVAGPGKCHAGQAR